MARPSVLYLSHGGGPLPLLGDAGHQEMVSTLNRIAGRIPRPDAILVISAHWEEKQPTVTGGDLPELIYDYYGFPDAAYEIQYPCPGHPVLAEQVSSLLERADLSPVVDTTRGFDHGLFVPLKIMYPDATIPCIQLSLLESMDAEQHLRLGEALRGLNEGNLLVIGSGFSFHNMRAFFSPDTAETRTRNIDFDQWLSDTLSGDMPDSTRRHRLANWQDAPHARYCHPREEHLLPLQVCYGLAQGRPAPARYHCDILGKRATMFLWQDDTFS